MRPLTKFLWFLLALFAACPRRRFRVWVVCFIAVLHPAATFSSRSSVSGYLRTSSTSAAA